MDTVMTEQLISRVDAWMLKWDAWLQTTEDRQNWARVVLASGIGDSSEQEWNLACACVGGVGQLDPH
jgi:hypothetical protein